MRAVGNRRRVPVDAVRCSQEAAAITREQWRECACPWSTISQWKACALRRIRTAGVAAGSGRFDLPRKLKETHSRRNQKNTVSQTFASWNQVAGWLRVLERLRRAG